MDGIGTGTGAWVHVAVIPCGRSFVICSVFVTSLAERENGEELLEV